MTKFSEKKNHEVENPDGGIGTPSKRSKKDAQSDCISYKIRLLDSGQENLEISIPKNENGHKLFSIICDKLGGIVECDYFGLRYTDKHNQRQWLDLGRNVKKQLASALSTSLSLRVKHYPGNPVEDFHQNISQYLLYLQIRRDLIQGRLLCTLEDIHLLGALILQAELGDAPEDHTVNVSTNSSDKSLEEQQESTEFGPISSPMSPDLDKFTSSSSPNNDFFENFKIVFNQTKKIEKKIYEKYKSLRGLTARDAELEIIKLASKLDTYGVDPFPVKIIQKKSSPKKGAISVFDGSINRTYQSGDTASAKTAPAELQNCISTDESKIPGTNSVYLGLRHTGLTTYIGLKPSEHISWSSINRLACDGKDFIVYINADEVSRTKPRQMVFRCESKAAALALWTWTIDRKSFFTLKAASEAKKTKSSSNIFRRSRSYRFIGKSQMELKSIANLQVPLPQPEFIRVSSLRRPPKTPHDFHSNQQTIFSTLPSRPKPSKIFENTDRTCENLRRESLLTPVAEQEPVEEIVDATSHLQDKKVMRINEDLKSAPVDLPETPIRAVSAGPTQMTAPPCVPRLRDGDSTSPEEDPHKISQLRCRKDIDDSESIRAVEAIDKALENHEAKLPKKYNGKMQHRMRDFPDTSQEGNISTTKLAAFFFVILFIIMILGALETTRRPIDTPNSWANFALVIRRQPLISMFDRYLYAPIRGYVVILHGSVSSMFN